MSKRNNNYQDKYYEQKGNFLYPDKGKGVTSNIIKGYRSQKGDKDQGKGANSHN